MPKMEPLFHDTYTGPRWTYGLRNRPAMYATVPDGRIIGSDKPHDYYLHGTIDYPRELTAKECYDYELTLVGPIDTERAIRRAAALVYVDNGMLDLWREVGMLDAEAVYATEHLEEVRAKVRELFGWEGK